MLFEECYVTLCIMRIWEYVEYPKQLSTYIPNYMSWADFDSLQITVSNKQIPNVCALRIVNAPCLWLFRSSCGGNCCIVTWKEEHASERANGWTRRADRRREESEGNSKRCRNIKSKNTSTLSWDFTVLAQQITRECFSCAWLCSFCAKSIFIVPFTNLLTPHTPIHLPQSSFSTYIMCVAVSLKFIPNGRNPHDSLRVSYSMCVVRC